MTRHILLFAALIAVGVPAIPAAAQSDAIVQGQVIAAADRSALPGATVTLQAAAGRLPKEATTDADGRFVFAQVAPDQYVVSVGVDGFEPRHMVMTIEPREVRVLSLPLDVARLNVNVRVTADVATLPATHSPSSTMLTKESIERMPAFARRSLPDAIVTSAPGMIRGHDDFVHVRGEEIALNPIIDGVAFWENPHAMFSAGVSPDIIETANVMTGAFPAEYGNRFGGVVDVATKSGLRMHERGSATFSIGDDGRRHAAADVGGRRGSFGYFLLRRGARLEPVSESSRPGSHSRCRRRTACVRSLRLERRTHRRHERRRHGRRGRCADPEDATGCGAAAGRERGPGRTPADAHVRLDARVVDQRRRCDRVPALVAAAAVSCGRSA